MRRALVTSATHRLPADEPKLALSLSLVQRRGEEEVRKKLEGNAGAERKGIYLLNLPLCAFAHPA